MSRLICASRRRVTSKSRPIKLALILGLLLGTPACSYLSYNVTERSVELPPKQSTQESIRVESSRIEGSALQLEIVKATQIDQTIETRIERSVDYEPIGGLVYEGLGMPVIDVAVSIVYFIPDALGFVGSSLVMWPAGAWAARDSVEEKAGETQTRDSPLVNAPIDVAIADLDLRKRVKTDAEGRVSVDLSGVAPYRGDGPLSVRVLSRTDGLVAKSSLSEAQLVELRPALPQLAKIAKPEPPKAAALAVVVPTAGANSPSPQPAAGGVAVRVDGDANDAQIDRTLQVTSASLESFDSLRRVALVIGNSEYRSLTPLANPKRDATDLASVLRSVGFEVILRKEQNLSQMKSGLREFAARLGPDTVGLFYYAGHAVQSDGSNYLIPLGADIASPDEIEYEALDMARVLGKMEASQSPVKLVFVDACRNNPYARFRSASRGLAITPAPGGTLIAYATAPGDVASDGDGDNSPFARHLISAIDTPGLELKQVIAKVQQGVFVETESRQRPWLSSDIFRDFYFRAPETN